MRAHVFTAAREEDRHGKAEFVARIEYDVPADTDVKALAAIGKEINQGDGKINELWKSMAFPPLGVGDLILLDKDRWYYCESTGWKRTDRPESVPAEPGAVESDRRVRRG